jgi:hypothetical protein
LFLLGTLGCNDTDAEADIRAAHGHARFFARHSSASWNPAFAFVLWG